MKAYVLVSGEPGKSSDIFDNISDIDVVESIEAVTGSHDFVVTVEADSFESFTDPVFGEIRGIDGVNSTTTLIVVGSE
ncbi:MAG: Lrp/AsnC ligand binding domain-containing protein [Candidatus Aenigmatarchaeota archaeon]